MQAKGADDPSLVSELLSNGASPSASGLYNYTAIMWAVVRHKVATLQALLDAGGDPSPINAWSRHTRLAGSMLLRRVVSPVTVCVGAATHAKLPFVHVKLIDPDDMYNHGRIIAVPEGACHLQRAAVCDDSALFHPVINLRKSA